MYSMYVLYAILLYHHLILMLLPIPLPFPFPFLSCFLCISLFPCPAPRKLICRASHFVTRTVEGREQTWNRPRETSALSRAALCSVPYISWEYCSRGFSAYPKTKAAGFSTHPCLCEWSSLFPKDAPCLG